MTNPFSPSSSAWPRVAIVGAGPAGLMAAQRLSSLPVQIDVYDTMPTAGRKFLLAGIGGLNLTHSEPPQAFLKRYGARSAQVQPWLQAFSPGDVRAWAQDLGIDTFIGSSGRVFPRDMKAAPLLRAWLHRLRAGGVRFHMQHRMTDLSEGRGLRFATPKGDEVDVQADAVVLATGGASWPRLGSDGAWFSLLQRHGVPLAKLQPSNCGFDVAAWSEHFRTRYAGQPLKSVAVSLNTADGRVFHQAGEFVITETGVEGSLVYAASSLLRDQIAAHGNATLYIDLLPARSIDWVANELAHPRGPRSLSTHLKSRLGLHGVKTGLMHELIAKPDFADAQQLASKIKALPLQLVAARPVAEVISTAGGVCFEAMGEGLMLKALPGVFCAGEMVDWEAPTGGYLLTGCLASGVIAAQGVTHWLGAQ